MKTPDQLRANLQSKIPRYIHKAMSGILTGERYQEFNFQDAKKCIEWNYTKCGYRVPLIIVTENPLEMQLMFNYIQHINKFLDTKDDGVCVALRSQLLSQLSTNPQTMLGVQLESMLRSRIGSRRFPEINSNFIHNLDRQLNLRLYNVLFTELDAKLEIKIGSQLSTLLKEPMRTLLGDQLGDSLDQIIRGALNAQEHDLNYVHPTYLFTTNFYSDCIYTWYEFARKELNLQLSINEDFQTCFELQRNSGIGQAIFAEDLCVISRYPVNVTCNTQPKMDRIELIRWGASSLYTLLDCSFSKAAITRQRSTHAPFNSIGMYPSSKSAVRHIRTIS